MNLSQAAILAPVPAVGCYLFFSLRSASESALRTCLHPFKALAAAFQLDLQIDAFRHGQGPKGAAAQAAGWVHDDGVTDALFNISTPLTRALGGCPPTQGGRLDLRQVSL